MILVVPQAQEEKEAVLAFITCRKVILAINFCVKKLRYFRYVIDWSVISEAQLYNEGLFILILLFPHSHCFCIKNKIKKIRLLLNFLKLTLHPVSDNLEG